MVTHKTDILCFLKIYFNIYQVHPVNVYWPFIEYLMKIFLSKYLNENMRRQLILNTGWWFIKIFNSACFINTYFMDFNHFQVSSTCEMINILIKDKGRILTPPVSELRSGKNCFPLIYPLQLKLGLNFDWSFCMFHWKLVIAEAPSGFISFCKTFKQQKNQILMEISKKFSNSCLFVTTFSIFVFCLW